MDERRRRPYRLILDTNVWIRLLTSKRRTPASILAPMLTSGNFVLLFSPELIAEVEEVRQRPRLAKRLAQHAFTPLAEALVAAGYAVVMVPSSTVTLCRDPKDNFLLELALDGKADFLVSDDGDLLALRPVCCGATIMAPADFDALLRKLAAGA